MKEAMTQGLKETLDTAFKLDFQAANIGIKREFFCFLKRALIAMIHKGTLDIILMKKSWSNTSLRYVYGRSSEKEDRNSALEQDHAEPMGWTTKRKSEVEVEKNDE